MRRFRIDEEREPVKEVQTYLLELAYADPRIPKVVINGHYGENTRNAVRAFQGIEEIEETGIVDFTTWEILFQRYAEQNKARTEETPLPHVSEFNLRLGDTGYAVIILQSLLTEFSRIYPAVTRPAVTGQFGLATADAVRALERTYGRYADGIVTADLWNHMLRDYLAKNATIPQREGRTPPA